MKVKDLMEILSKVDPDDAIIIRYLDVDGYGSADYSQMDLEDYHISTKQIEQLDGFAIKNVEAVVLDIANDM